MTFFELLERETTDERERLLATPVIDDCLRGTVARETYGAFLAEAYHHVRHTVPLLMATGARLPARLEWLREAIVEYIGEEYGHEQWILNDLTALGLDATAHVARGPSFATELMVSYAYDTVQRGNPVGFFGMVLVLEGTSAAIASRAAAIIGERLDLPRAALTYLASHGRLDREHVGHLERLLNRLDEEADRAAVVHAARAFYRLYSSIFAGLPRAVAASIEARAVA